MAASSVRDQEPSDTVHAWQKHWHAAIGTPIRCYMIVSDGRMHLPPVHVSQPLFREFKVMHDTAINDMHNDAWWCLNRWEALPWEWNGNHDKIANSHRASYSQDRHCCQIRHQ